MEDPVCSGTGDTVKQASYLIKEAVPTIKFSGTVYNDRTATTRWTSKRTGPRWSRWPRTSTSTSCARTKSCRRRRWRPARAAISSPRPAIRTTPSSCRTPRQSSHAPGLLAFQEPGVRHSRPLFEGQDTQDFGLTPATVASLSKAFDQIRIPLQGKAKVIFKLKNNNNGLDQHDGLAFTDLLPEGLVIDGQPQAAQCGGTVTVSTQNGRSRLRFAGGSLPKGVSSCDVTATVLGQTLGLKTNDQSNLERGLIQPGRIGQCQHSRRPELRRGGCGLPRRQRQRPSRRGRRRRRRNVVGR